MAQNPTSDSDKNRSEETIFAAAMQWDSLEARRAYLDEACRGDAGLRERIERLLEASASARTFLEKPAAAPISEVPGAVRETISLHLTDLSDEIEGPGSKIGRYKILQQIGEGGCGTVFMAEQEEPVRRRVALKVIKLGMDTRSVVARFEAERQALAMMDHPNIAKVLDAGATDSGRPYFVMELVRGVPITHYCDQNRLDTGQRLELFMEVCQAVQHAHQKGIIHRDIKPSNILVTLQDGSPTPKVIDFGIAKATEGRLTDRTLFTAFEQFIGTPAYMSPEQAELSGLDIDTRSDIYSLGVLLYELLTGRPPFDPRELAQAGLDEVRRRIREVEPHRPSTRLSTLAGDALVATAHAQGTGPVELVERVRGDLDWIVMRCLEKDRARRYETANGLAADIRRHLQSEPVLARPPSSAYRMRKAIQRNRAAFASVIAVFVALLLGMVAAAMQATRATRAEVEQRRLAETANTARLEAEDARKRVVTALGEVQSAKTREEGLRQMAEQQRQEARRQAYASDMILAQRSLEVPNVREASALLDRHRPKPGEVDLRGWEWRYLWQFCRSEARLELGRVAGVPQELSFSPDGRLAVVATDSEVSLWDVAGRRLVQPSWGDLEVSTAEFAPRENLLAISWGDPEKGTVALVDPLDPSVRRVMDGRSRVARFRFSDDGRRLMGYVYLAHGFTRPFIHVWDTTTGQIIHRVELLNSTANQLPDEYTAVSPDLSRFVMPGFPRQILVVRELQTAAGVWTNRAAEENVTTVEFSPDRRLIATGAGFTESTIRIWDAATGGIIRTLEGHRGWTAGLRFMDGGKSLVSISADQTVRIWDVERGTTTSVLNGHQAQVWRVTTSRDDQQILTADRDGRLLLWDRQSSTRALPFVQITNVGVNGSDWRLSADGRSVVGLHARNQITRWSGAQLDRIETLVPAKDMLNSIIRLSEYGNRAIAASWSDRTLKVFDLGTTPPRSWGFPFANSGGLYGLTSSGEGIVEWTNSVTGDWVNELDSTTLKVRSSRRFEPRTIHDLLGDGSGDWMLAGEGPEEEHATKAVNWRTGVITRVYRDPLFARTDTAAGAVSPDGRYVGYATRAGSVLVLTVPEMTRHLTLRGNMLDETSLVFSPDGRRVLTASGGREAVKVWDLESGLLLLVLPAKGSGHSNLRFSADGNVLASANEFGLHVWRSPSLEEIAAAEERERLAQEVVAGAESQIGVGHAMRGFRLARQGQTDGAMEAWRQAVRMAPRGLVRTRLALAEALLDRGLLEELAGVVRPLLEGGVEREAAARAELCLGVALLAPSAQPTAGKDLFQLWLGDPAASSESDRLKHAKDAATAHWWLGHTNEAVALCRQLLSGVGDSKNLWAIDRAAKAVLCRSGMDPVLVSQACRLTAVLEQDSEHNPDRAWFRITSAMGAFRSGRTERALQLVDPVLIDSPRGGEVWMLAMAWRGLCQAQLGNTEAAKLALAQLRPYLLAHPPAPRASGILLKPDLMAAAFAAEEAERILVGRGH